MDAQMHDQAEATRILEATKALAPQIRDAADTSEAERRLSPAVVRAMKEAGVFCLAIPLLGQKPLSEKWPTSREKWRLFCSKSA